jgi:hypothetical protein
VTPEEAAVAARAQQERLVYIYGGGIVAGIGGLVFWGLNNLERSGRRNQRPHHGGVDDGD